MPASPLATVVSVGLATLLSFAPQLAGAPGAAGAAPARASGETHANSAQTDFGKGIRLPADAVKRLKSGDPVQVKSALDDVRVSAKAGAPAVPAIVDLLAEGLPPELAQEAIDALGDTESEAASSSLSWYARHRNLRLRRSAVQALARTRGAVAVKALRTALSDFDPEVRGLAATGLGTLKAKEAVGDLFLALDHKVPEASRSIGLLCTGDECDRLAAKLGSQPFEVMTSGLHEALLRLSDDVPEELKVKIVGRVRELGTGEANRFLREIQAKWPQRGSRRVKQAIDQAVLATSGSPGAGARDPEGKTP
jgi:HEAT repeat protein